MTTPIRFYSMKRSTLLAIVCWCLCSVNALADSFPFNKSRTHVGEAYTTLRLTPEQETQVERTMILTLTEEQLPMLKKIGAACPKKLLILPSYYRDCTCGMRAIAVWFRQGEVEVPHSFIPRSKKVAEMFANYDESRSGFVIDPDGILFYQGEIVTDQRILELSKLKASNLEGISPESSDREPSVFISTPPKACIRNMSQVSRRIRVLASLVSKGGGRLYAPGFTKVVRIQ